MFRILSVDGGGVRGYLAAATLSNIESYLNELRGEAVPLGLRFDFICGTSAGGLIALGLALGRTAVSMRDLFVELVPQVFSRKNRTALPVRGIYPRYSSAPLAQCLEGYFDRKTLRDLSVDACITSVSLIDAKPRLHKTDYLARNAGRMDELLLNIALATTAAPTYFSAASAIHSANLIDGGIAANNPSLVALVDALQFERPSKRGTPTPSLDSNTPVLVSIGTGQPGPLPYKHDKLANGGWIHWIKPIFEVVQLSQAQLVHHQAQFLLGEKYLRIDPLLNVPVELDDAEHFLELRNKADIDEKSEDFLRRYF